MIKYCKNCVYPATKRDLTLDENGICDACRFLNIKKEIDWDGRKAELKKILEQYRNKNDNNYDCIIPVSGGKDSHYQTYVIKEEFGLNPLVVAFRPREWTELGRKNLENLKKQFNVDCIEFTPKRDVYLKMQKVGLLDFGDASWPEHFGIFTVPVQIAVQQKIPLLVWGENAQAEYGGPVEDSNKSELDSNWRKNYGTTIEVKNSTESYHGPEHMLQYDIKIKDLIPYMYPDDNEIKKVGVKGIFLGHFIQWDAIKQVEKMKEYGFILHEGPSEGTYSNHENLDNKGQGLHDYMKWIKFGYGRATDNASIDIRHGRLLRNEAIELVKKHEGKIPEKYLDEYLRDFELTREEFYSLVDKFANKELFIKDEQGNLLRDKEGNIEKINYDNI
jgi:N-acetyl sugar amidotransferase